MSSLLSPFNFGQKHAYFHAKITIHELTNVPLVTGNFKTRWRVKNHHNLQGIPFSHADNDRDTLAGSEDGGERRSLNHKKSFASSIASQDNATSENGKRLSTSSKGDHKTSTKQDGSRERKTSNRIFSGFKDAFNQKNRKPSSTSEAKQNSTSAEGNNSHNQDNEKRHGESSVHSKHESYDSSRFDKPKRQTSFTDSVKISSFSEKDHTPSSHPSSLLHLETRGETTNEKVKDHTVKWERTIDVGIRVPIEKQKLNEKGHNSGTPAATASGALTPSGPGPGSSDGHSSAPGNRSSVGGDSKSIPSTRSMGDMKNENGESKGERQDKEVREKEKDRDMADAWGMLGNAELKLTIKAEIATDTAGHHHASDSHMTMGHVVVNLAEFAPYPESNAHQHHHQLHHHHAYSHYHPHPHHLHHSMTLSRTETRRYLLADSRNNATLKMTIELIHVGGTKEYAVPAIRRGIIVAGVSSLIDAASQAGGSGPNSEAGHSTEGQGHERSKSNDGRYSVSRNPSISSISQEPMSAWPTNSVAKHVRIPSSNLRTEVSHQDAARAVKEAGGQRMGFSFGAGAHHERPPEDVIDALFNTNSSSHLANMLTPNRAEEDKQGKIASRKKRDDAQNMPREKKSDDKIERGVLPEKPPHYDGVGPAEHPKDSAQTTGSSLSRFSFDHGSIPNRPGIDMPLQTEQRRGSKSSDEHKEGKHSTHKRDLSGNTMRSILANSTSSKPSSRSTNLAGAPTSSTSSGGTSSQESSLANQQNPSYSSGQSHKINLVHWDASVSHDSHEEDLLTPPASSNLTVPTARLTTSPSIMSRHASDDTLSPIEPIRKSSNVEARKSPFSTRDVEEDDEEEEHTAVQALTPPATPPDAERKGFKFSVKDGEFIKVDNNNTRNAKGTAIVTKGARGLTKEEALQKGYRGAGWGTMEVLRPLQRIPSVEGSPYNFSHGIYSGSKTPSPASQSRDAISS